MYATNYQIFMPMCLKHLGPSDKFALYIADTANSRDHCVFILYNSIKGQNKTNFQI